MDYNRLAMCRDRKSGTVIVIVLGVIMLVSALMLQFINRTGQSMLLQAKTSDVSVLRGQAYSSLEVTLATLAEFRQLDGALYQRQQGWGDPLGYSEYAPENSKITVSFEDETGKLSLPTASSDMLIGLFKASGLKQADAETAADALLYWTRKDYVPANSLVGDQAYEYADPPIAPPKRPMQSFQELTSIAGLSTLVCDSQGRPNNVWRGIMRGSTLYNVSKLNVNSVQSATLQAMGWDNPQIASLRNALSSPSFLNPSGRLTMPTLPSLDGVSDSVFGTEIEVLTIHVDVRSGGSQFQLQATIEVQKKGDDAHANDHKADRSAFRYPFQILELSEDPESAPSGPIFKEAQ